MKILRIHILVAFALGAGTGSGLTFLSSRLGPSQSGFSLEEAQAKLGRRVKLIDNSQDPPRIVNTGTVAFINEIHEQRYLVIDWDELNPGMRHRITQQTRETYERVIVEE